MNSDEYSPTLCTTTPIRYLNYRGGGTGFYFNYPDMTFIITNRHVVDPDNVCINEIRIWFRNYPDFRDVNPFDISLSGGEDVDWFGHPNDDVDLAAIPLDQKLSPLDDVENGDPVTGSLAWTPEWYLYEKVDMTNDISILGYPGEFVDRTTMFPVERNAMISSPHRHQFEDNPYFITDARMHPGTSGSPVIWKLPELRAINPNFPDERRHPVYLLGVHSATFYPNNLTEVDSADPWEEFQNDGPTDIEERRESMKYELNVAWYAELINEMLEGAQ